MSNGLPTMGQPHEYELMESLKLINVPLNEFKALHQKVETQLKEKLNSTFTAENLLRHIINGAIEAISRIKAFEQLDQQHSTSLNASATSEEVTTTTNEDNLSKTTPDTTTRVEHTFKKMSIEHRTPTKTNDSSRLASTSNDSSTQTNQRQENVETIDLADDEEQMEEEEPARRITRSSTKSSNQQREVSPIAEVSDTHEQVEQPKTRPKRTAASKARARIQSIAPLAYPKQHPIILPNSPPKGPLQTPEALRRRRLVSSSSELDDDPELEQTSNSRALGQPPSKLMKDGKTPKKRRKTTGSCKDSSYEQKSENDSTDDDMDYDPNASENTPPVRKARSSTAKPQEPIVITVEDSDDETTKSNQPTQQQNKNQKTQDLPLILPGGNKISATADNDRKEISYVYGRFQKKESKCTRCDKVANTNKKGACLTCHNDAIKYADEQSKTGRIRILELYLKYLDGNIQQ